MDFQWPQVTPSNIANHFHDEPLDTTMRQMKNYEAILVDKVALRTHQ